MLPLPHHQESHWHFLWLRMGLLVAIALLPAVAIIAHTFFDLRESSYATVRERLVGFTDVATAQQERFMEGARQFLLALSYIPEVRSLDPQRCTITLTHILKENPIYRNLSVVDDEGYSICSVFPLDRSVSAHHQSWFRKGVAAKSFTIGEYHVDSITGQPVVDVVFPILEEGGRVQGVIVAALSLDWLNEMAARATLPKDTTLTIFDRNHTILMRQPDGHQWVGLRASRHPQSLLEAQRREGIMLSPDLDGTLRLHAFTIFPSSGLPGAYVRMSMAETAILAEIYQNLRRNLLLFLIGTALTVLVAWLSGRFLIGHFLVEHGRIDTLKSEFIALASHQLRTPLTSIRWIFDTLRRQDYPPFSPEIQELLSDGHTSTDRMSQTINTMLMISRAEAGTLPLHYLSLSLHPFLATLQKEMLPLAVQKGLTLALHVPQHLTVTSDPALLQEILRNLLWNAIKYTGRGTITIAAEAPSLATVRIMVQDTGIGISTFEQQKVFTKFFRGKEAAEQDTEGAGLGLYLAQTLTTLLQGRMVFASEPNRGTTFTIILPQIPHASHG